MAKTVRVRRGWAPSVINTDRNPAYGGNDPKVESVEVHQLFGVYA